MRDIEKELVIDSGVIISNKLLLNAETKEPTRFVITTDFKNQANFEIISISLDKKRDNWVKAVQKDNMIWTTACDLQGYNGSVVAIYNIKYVPRNYLIDPAVLGL